MGPYLRFRKVAEGFTFRSAHGLRPPERQRQSAQDDAQRHHRQLQDGPLSGWDRICDFEKWRRDLHSDLLTAFDPLKGRGRVLRTMPNDTTANFKTDLSPDGTVFAISKSGGEIHIPICSRPSTP